MGSDRGWLPFIDMLAVLPRQNRFRWAASYHRENRYGARGAAASTVGSDAAEVKFCAPDLRARLLAARWRWR